MYWVSLGDRAGLYQVTNTPSERPMRTLRFGNNQPQDLHADKRWSPSLLSCAPPSPMAEKSWTMSCGLTRNLKQRKPKVSAPFCLPLQAGQRARLSRWEGAGQELPGVGLAGFTASQEAKAPPLERGQQVQRCLPDSKNAPLCRATRLSVNMFFHVKPLVAR